ncbi:hypothetical protein CCACVL1_18597 [Corchorus capsularis]|uniref:Uncharacterized protein n=1 Tax=Corchorus capsularis TaxID=210143 RepID=A0A1R3HKJ1_COCAP|nr:hypothetical protein CCACVL1_18597 [Corchorus capsularis]
MGILFKCEIFPVISQPNFAITFSQFDFPLCTSWVGDLQEYRA